MNNLIQKLKEYFSLSNALVYASIFWVIYSLTVLSCGSCSYYTEEVNGEWYVKYTESDVDETGNDYEITDYGPISEKEANQIVEDCENQANTWMQSYGSVYRYSDGNGFLSTLYFMLIMASPLFLLWLIGKWYRKE